MPESLQVYLAGPLFTHAEWMWNQHLASAMRGAGFTVFVPQEAASEMVSGAIPFDAHAVFATNLAALKSCAAVVAILDGADSDSGTCWECGCAFALGIPVVGVRTDLRQSGDDGSLNLMLTQSCTAVVSVSPTDRTALSVLAARVCSYLREAVKGHDLPQIAD